MAVAKGFKSIQGMSMFRVSALVFIFALVGCDFSSFHLGKQPDTRQPLSGALLNLPADIKNDIAYEAITHGKNRDDILVMTFQSAKYGYLRLSNEDISWHVETVNKILHLLSTEECATVMLSAKITPDVIKSFDAALLRLDEKERAKFIDQTIRAFRAIILASPPEPQIDFEVLTDAYSRFVSKLSYENQMGVVYISDSYKEEKSTRPFDSAAVCRAGRALYEQYGEMKPDEQPLIARSLVKFFW
ncbi:hypothetical protein M6G53_05145 [Serratia nevei]|uniref:hypothetical protein n=1 Tax=Serratia nevei TaxID=2703794 RepID=UPI00209E22F6|nr:hypothetical protein [Serratia nevei]MCP1104785.1 hypothetical protein [Serratia nevei]